MGDKTTRKERIYLVTRDSQYKLASMFMRFQEYYESKKFSGKFFTWEEYMDAYAEEYGEFSYFEDYEGFNIPSYIFEPFRKGKFDPLTKKERELLRLFRSKRGAFNVLGAVLDKKMDAAILKHEFLHALFSLYPAYRKMVLRCLKEFNLRKIKKALGKAEYHKRVHNDEVNAYVLTNLDGLDDLKRGDVKDLRRALLKIFVDFFGYDLTKKKTKFLLDKVHHIHL